MIQRLAIVLLFIFFQSVPCAHGLSGFERVYGGSNQASGVVIRPTADRGFVVAGTSKDPFYGTFGYYLLKIDSTGQVEWTQNYGDAFDAFSSSIVTTYDGGYAVVGTHIGVFYDGVAEVLKFDSAGNLVFSNGYPPSDGWGTSGIGILETADSNLAISVYTDGFISQNYYSIYKLAPDLSTNWTNFIAYDGSIMNNHDVVQEQGGNFYSLAYYDNFYYTFPNIPVATAVRTFTPEGLLVKDTLYELQTVSHSITPAFDGGFLICGQKDSATSATIRLSRFDRWGSLLWQKDIYAGVLSPSCMAVQTADSGFVVAASVAVPSFNNQKDILLFKVSSNSDSLWARTFGGAFDEIAMHLEETPDHGLVILGSTQSFGDDHVYIVKTDSAGLLSTPYAVSGSGHYFCQGDTLALTLFPVPATNSHVVWTNGDTAQSILVTHSGNYSASVVDSTGAEFLTQNYFAFFADTPVANLGIADTVSICDRTVLSNQLNSDPSWSYQWIRNDTLLAGENTASITPVQSGLYKLVVQNYCTSDTAVLFLDSIYSLPSRPSLSSIVPVTICPGDSFRLAVLETGFGFQWWQPGAAGFDAIPGATDSILWLSQQGEYLVSVTDANGCAAFSRPFDLSVDADPVYVNASGPISFCAGGQVELSAATGLSYSWSTGDTLASILVSASGDFSYGMISSYGCPKFSDTLQISVNPLPYVFLGADTLICDTLHLVLDPGSGFNAYQWQDGSTAQTYTIASAIPAPDSADFFVFVTDTNGCTNSDTLRVYFDICEQVSEIQKPEVFLYPNPSDADGGFWVNSPGQENAFFEIVDMSGRILWSKELHQNGPQFFISGLSRGVYLVKISRNNEILKVGKVILQ